MILTLREAPADAEIVSHKLLLRAGGGVGDGQLTVERAVALPKSAKSALACGECFLYFPRPD